MLAFRSPKVMEVSLARRFMTLTGPSSLLLFTAETVFSDRKRTKGYESQLTICLNTALYCLCINIVVKQLVYPVGILVCIQQGVHCCSLVHPIPE